MMDKLKNLIKAHQQVLVLTVGYFLVAILGFSLGRFTAPQYSVPEIKVEQALTAPDNYTPNIAGIQSDTSQQAVQTCQGKIKGSSSMVYHLPGGSFYNKTTHPIRCFDTEAEAKAAGFRKSSR